MKSELRDGTPIVINETAQESLETLNHFLNKLQFGPLSENEAKDWGIQAGMTNAELYQMAADYASDAHTEMCAWHNRHNDPTLQDIARE